MGMLRNDDVALVTGGGSGIGRAVALAYAREGARVVVSDIVEANGQETVRLVEQAGGQAVFVRADISKPFDCDNQVQVALSTYGRLTIACNNAGIGGEANNAADYSVEGWQKVIDINLTGVFLSMKYELPAMLAAGGGAIVNIASILGKVGFNAAPAYVAAKHGVVGLTSATALDYATQNIRVNAIGPGFIRTPLLAGIEADKAVDAAITAMHPMMRMGQSEEVAEAALWLSSPGASFVTGTYLAVDGGFLAK